MKKLLFLLLFFPACIFAQKVSVGICIAPEYNNLIIKKDFFPDTQTSTGQLGFSSGVSLIFNPKGRLSVRTGVGYGLKRMKHTYNYTNHILLDTPGQLIPTKSNSQFTFHTIEVPLILQLNVIKKKVFVAGGLSFDFLSLAKSSKKTTYYSNHTPRTFDIKTNTDKSAAYLISVGTHYYLGAKMYFLIEPYFKYYPHVFTTPGTNIYSIGLKVTSRIF